MAKKQQLSIPGTERSVNQKVEEKGDALVDAIAKMTKARVKRHEAEAAVIETMKAEGVKEYVNTDVEPPIWIVLSAKDVVKVKKWKAPEERAEEAAA